MEQYLIKLDEKVQLILKELEGIKVILNQKSKIETYQSESINLKYQLDNEGTLIEKFQYELDRYAVNVDLNSYDYDYSTIHSKIVFYLTNKDKINNKNSYLTKIVSQFGLRKKDKIKEDKIDKLIDKELKDEYIAKALKEYDEIDDDLLQKIRFESETVMWTIGQKKANQLKTYEKLLVVKEGIKVGLLNEIIL